MEMDKLLSGEASRLNYPLKINRVIVENSLEEELEVRVKNYPNCLLLVNAKTVNDMLDSTNEIVRLAKKTGVPSIIVPPGKQFKSFMSVLMPLNLDQNNYSSLSDLKFLFEHFNLTIDAVGFASDGDYSEKELKARAWKETVSNYYLPKADVKINILEGKDLINISSNYFSHNHHDLLIIFNNNNKSVGFNTTKFLKEIKSPVLVYFS
jgi:hypothetical protein